MSKPSNLIMLSPARAGLLPAVLLAGAALLFTFVWANTGNRRALPTYVPTSHPTSPDHASDHPAPHEPGGTPESARPGPYETRSIDDLLALLQSQDAVPRAAAADALSKRSPYAVVPRLQPWVDEQRARGSLTEEQLADLLRVYRGMGVVELSTLEQALASRSTRAQAVRALGEWWDRVPNRYAKLTAVADDASANVRREALRVCAIADTAQAAGIAQLTRGHPMDAELSDIYDTTMLQLARHGPPIPAASRRQRVAAMSYDELLNEPRDGLVLTALLLHPDLPNKAFEPTLAEAAELAGHEPVDQLIQIISSASPEQLRRQLALGNALAHRPTDELAPRLDRLIDMAKGEQSFAYYFAAPAVARVMLKNDLPATLEATRQALGDLQLLLRISLIPEPEIRDRLLPLVTPLLTATAPSTDSDTHTLRVLAVTALPHIPAAADTLFETLAAIAREDPDKVVRFTAIQALDDIPPADWPPGHDDLELTRIVLRAVPNQMAYNPTRFAVTAGRPVIIDLINPDTMEHNLVIAAPGKLADVGLDAALLGDAGGPDGTFVPDSPNVLHYTAMVQPGQRTSLQFIAPDTPGDYPFVCTYPGHWMTMNGTMHVAAP